MDRSPRLHAGHQEEPTIKFFELEFLLEHQRIIGIVTLVIGIGAWVTELLGMVYVCPYCRMQRTAIALLGILLLLPTPRRWIVRYLGSVIGAMGVIVAANQNFMHWKRISSGEFTFNENILIDPFLLSGAALFILIAQLWILLPGRHAEGSGLSRGSIC